MCRLPAKLQSDGTCPLLVQWHHGVFDLGSNDQLNDQRCLVSPPSRKERGDPESLCATTRSRSLRDDIREVKNHGPARVHSPSSRGQQACSGRTLGKDLKALGLQLSRQLYNCSLSKRRSVLVLHSNYVVPNSASLSSPATSQSGRIRFPQTASKKS